MHSRYADVMQPAIQGREIREKFNECWTPEPFSGCWLWIGAIRTNRIGNEYGALADGKGGQFAAHRLSFEIHIGLIAVGHFVLHRCDTTLCVNPAHLFTGTQFDNMRDCALKNRNWRLRKLRPDQVVKIRESTEATAFLADRFGVAMATIYAIRSGRTWEHLVNNQARIGSETIETNADLLNVDPIGVTETLAHLSR